MYIWTLALKPFVDYPIGTSHCLKQTQKLDKPINKGLFRLLRVATFTQCPRRPSICSLLQGKIYFLLPLALLSQ